LIELSRKKPSPFEPGEAQFWDDPHISKMMLAAHLDPNTDAASRRPEVIERSSEWITGVLELNAGDAVLDLGCGPGLYASHLAQMGLRVTGLDLSPRSIEYAREQACERGLDIEYNVGDYLELDEDESQDAVLLIYGDICVLSAEKRRLLLSRIHRALRPDGHLVLDVTTRIHREKHGCSNRWYATATGFWKPGPHLVLEAGYDYPEQSIWLDQYVVLDETGKVYVYRNWFQDYSPDTISKELQQTDFLVESTWGDLTGTELTVDSAWIGVVARKL
jgi:SAM-dependent methyltransferase